MMQRISVKDGYAEDRPSPPVAAIAVLLLSLAGLGIAAFLERGLYLNHDVAWYIEAARQIGFLSCRLYVECFLEPNPPLILWISAVVVRASDLVGLDPITGFRAFVVAVTLGVGTLLYRILGDVLRQDRWWPLALATAYVAIVNVAALSHFGQRDHLITLLLAPYLAAQALVSHQGTAGKAPVSAVASGILAGVAVALKPHYVLAIVACEAWGAFRMRSWRVLMRAELLALGAVGAVYLTSVAIVAPDYFAFIEVIRAAYASYRMPSVPLVAKTVVLAGVPVLALLLAFPNSRRESPALPFALASAAGTAAYFLQHMGFAYQEIPARTAGIFAMLYAVVWRLQPAAEASRIRPAFGAACIAVLLALQASLAQAALRAAHATPTGADAERPNEVTWTIDALRRYGHGGRVGFVATSVLPASQAVLYSGTRLANRMPALWLLPALVDITPDHDQSADTQRLRALLFESLRRDFMSDPPVVIVEQRGRVQAVSAGEFSPMRFLSADAQLDALFGQYREVERASFGRVQYAVYTRPAVVSADQGSMR